MSVEMDSKRTKLIQFVEEDIGITGQMGKLYAGGILNSLKLVMVLLRQMLCYELKIID